MLGDAAWIWAHKNLDAFELVVILEKVAGGVRRRLLMKIPFYISPTACVDLSGGLVNPIVILTILHLTDPIVWGNRLQWVLQ